MARCLTCTSEKEDEKSRRAEYASALIAASAVLRARGPAPIALFHEVRQPPRKPTNKTQQSATATFLRARACISTAIRVSVAFRLTPFIHSKLNAKIFSLAEACGRLTGRAPDVPDPGAWRPLLQILPQI